MPCLMRALLAWYIRTMSDENILICVLLPLVGKNLLHSSVLLFLGLLVHFSSNISEAEYN
jgi:hypothetical protein